MTTARSKPGRIEDRIEPGPTKQESSFDLFGPGRSMTHPDGTVVLYDDETWILAPGHRHIASVSFSGVPDWVQPWLKNVVATDWLRRRLSHTTLVVKASAARHLRVVFPDFEGPIEALTPDHTERLRHWALDRFQTLQRARAKAQLQLGRPLTSVERRKLAKGEEDTGLDTKTIRQVYGVLSSCIKAAEQEGKVKIDCHFSFPKGLADRERADGGGDPDKVLGPEQLTDLINALNEEIHEYRDKRAQLTEKVDVLLATEGQHYPPLTSPYHESRRFHALKRYFGLLGEDMSHLNDIAAHQGVTAAGFSRKIKHALRSTVPEKDVERLWNARKKSTLRGVSAEERETARRELHEYFRDFDFRSISAATVQSEAIDVVRRYFGMGTALHDHSALGLKALRRGVGGREETIEAVIEPAAAAAYGDNYREPLEQLIALRDEVATGLSRAICACGWLLQATAYRRVTAALDSLEVGTGGQWVDLPNGDRVFELRFVSRKMWGPRGLPEVVPLPGYFGEIAERALADAETFTMPFRQFAKGSAKNRLFISKGHGNVWTQPAPLVDATLGEYLRSSRGVDGGGLIARRDLQTCAHVTSHLFRNTQASHAISEGGSAIEMASLMGNSPEQVRKHYFSFSGANGQIREQAVAAANAGAFSGFLSDALLRVAKGPQHASHPSELSFEEAQDRILTTPEFVQDYTDADGNFGPTEAHQILSSGLRVNLTTYGGCILPAEEGVCPAVHECPVGVDAERNEADPTCGCRWQVKLPHDYAIQSYREDLEMLREQAEVVRNKPQFAAFYNPLKKRIEIREQQLKILDGHRETLRA